MLAASPDRSRLWGRFRPGWGQGLRGDQPPTITPLPAFFPFLPSFILFFFKSEETFLVFDLINPQFSYSTQYRQASYVSRQDETQIRATALPSL